MAATAQILRFDGIESGSEATTVSAGQTSALSTSYPDIDRALAAPAATMTGNGERERAFKRSGLR